jgi:aldehyde dehydrogenase (NAD+)
LFWAVEKPVEALAIANDTPYGLQAYILTSNLHRAHPLATRIDTGRVLINTLAHEPRVPSGL